MALGQPSSHIDGGIGATEVAQRKLGVGVYSRFLLSQYDLGVVRLSCSLLWRCPSKAIVELYDRHLSGNHLDVGVGTGYFLDHARFPVERPRLALMDLSTSALEYTANRLRRYNPEVYRGDVLGPVVGEIPSFDSIGMNFLLHCLPGPMARKAVALDVITPLLNPGGTLFGSTLVTQGRGIPLQARLWMRAYNAAGIFGNGADSAADLRAELEARFDDVHVEVRGAMAVFSARGR